LNLYYSVSNLVTIPQQHWIAKERARAQAMGPIKPKPS
jgi:membrane protein insertase Oxa1/YidC/SpoIIIJ